MRGIVDEELRRDQEPKHGRQVQNEITYSIDDILNSELILHIKRKTFLIDKSLVLIDFFGHDGALSPSTTKLYEISGFNLIFSNRFEVCDPEQVKRIKKTKKTLSPGGFFPDCEADAHWGYPCWRGESFS